MLTLVGANLNYSSWSIRPWLALRHADLPFRFHDVGLKTRDGWKERILGFSGAGKVPILIDGASSVHESLAICETVAELAPQKKLWPDDPKLRARGRAISCEMTSSFGALRSEMTCNLRARSRTPTLSDAAKADVARVVDVFTASIEGCGGPFLLGEFSIADCMYAPVASRFRTYSVALPEVAARYVEAVLGHPLFVELDALAKEQPPIAEYDAFVIPL